MDDGVQEICGRPSVGVHSQTGFHLRVSINQFVEELRMDDLLVGCFGRLIQEFAGHRQQPFQFELVTVHQHMSHLLFFVGLVPHIRQNDQTGTLLFVRPQRSSGLRMNSNKNATGKHHSNDSTNHAIHATTFCIKV